MLSTSMVIWLVRLRMRYARPCARGRNRLSVGPSSTYARDTMSVCGSSEKLFSALAMALASTFATGSLAACGANFSTDSASCAGRSRISSTTRRAFIGVTRTYVARANAVRTSSSGCVIVITSSPPRATVVPDVPAERARRRELAQLVAHHALGDEHRDVLAAVVHGDRVPEHVGDDRRAPRPGLDHSLGIRVVGDVDLLEQVVVDERPLLQTAWHSGLPLLVRTTTADDQLVARLVAAGAALGLAVRVHRVTSTGRLALATTVRVVDRVHGHAADGRALALPPHAAGLAPVDVGLLGVAHLADRRAAAHVDVADLTGGHPQLGERAFLGDQLDAGAGGAGDLGPATRAQLDRVHDRADRDVAQRQRVARLDVGARTVLDRVALLEQPRRDDVALLAVGVVQQRDAGGAVRVVLDVRDLGRNAVLVVPAEVDQPVRPLVTATLVPRGDLALVVAAALAVQRTHQRLLRGVTSDLDEVGHGRTAPSRRRRLVLTDTHQAVPIWPNTSIRSPARSVTMARLTLLRWP